MASLEVETAASSLEVEMAASLETEDCYREDQGGEGIQVEVRAMEEDKIQENLEGLEVDKLQKWGLWDLRKEEDKVQ